MKKLLILLLFVPLLSIGQTFTSSSVIQCDLDEYGNKSYGEPTKGQSIIIIGKNTISVNMFLDEPIVMEIERIKRTTDLINYYIINDKDITIVSYDYINTILLSFVSNNYPYDKSGTIYIFEYCKLVK